MAVLHQQVDSGSLEHVYNFSEIHEEQNILTTLGQYFLQCTREGWKDKLETQRNEGCLVTGHLEVNKVAGNFHFAPGKSFQQHHVHGEVSIK